MRRTREYQVADANPDAECGREMTVTVFTNFPPEFTFNPDL
jgi:hypothetical protein